MQMNCMQSEPVDFVSYGERIGFALEGEQHLVWAFDFRLGL